MKPLLSIITPVYNEDRYIVPFIISLERQTYQNFEVLLFDDGSTDATLPIIQKYADVFKPKLTVYSSEHLGSPGYYRNKGAVLAKGKILIFVDGDMEFPIDFLDKLTLKIRQGKAQATCHAKEYINNPESWIARTLYKRVRSDAVIGSKTRVARAILAKVFIDKGGFDTTKGYYDDEAPLDVEVVDATVYHNNPSTIKEVLYHVWWVFKSKVKK